MSTANGVSLYEGTGAGGKLRRKPIRKSQATPYDRPPTAVRNPSSGNGWFSKIIDPASKIITASAHRLFSSVFRKRLLPPPQQQTPLPPPAASQPASEIDRTTYSGLRGEIQANVGYTYQDRYGTQHLAQDHDSLDSNGVNQGVNELEKILEQKTFTKSEIDRLIALLNSRTIKAPAEDDEEAPEERASETIYGDIKFIERKCTLVPDSGIKSNRYLDATSSPITNTKVVEEDIATPAELAKAYMGSRSSKVSTSMLGSRGQAIRNDLPLINNVVFPSQSPSMSTATKTFSRLIAPENGFMTPRSRGRSAIYSMARTPYSRMQKSSEISNTYNFQSSQLALEPNKLSGSRQTILKRCSSVLDDDIDSVGPIRRIRQKPGLLPSQSLTGPASRSSPVNEPRLVSNYRSKDAARGTPDPNFLSVSSQPSEVAQKILQQLDILASSSKEKLSERKSTQLQGKPPFTLTPDMKTGKALRSLENVDSCKAQENSMLNDSVQRVTTNVDYTSLNCKNQAEENGPKRMTSVSNTNSEIALYSSDSPLSKNKRAFQMSAHEDYLDLDDNNGSLNVTSFAAAKEKVNFVNSSMENKPQMVNEVSANENSVSNEEMAHVSFHLDNKFDQDQEASNGPVISVKKNEVSYSAGSPTMTIQPTVTDNVSSSLFGLVSSGDQSTTTTHFGHGAQIADKFTPFTFSSSLPLANDSLAIQTSASSELKTPNSSALSDTPIIKADDNKGAQGTGDWEGNPSTASLYGVSTTSTLLSSSSVANNGFTNCSSSVQPVMTSSSAPPSGLKYANDDGAHNLNASLSPAFATSVPNTATGITSGGGGSLFLTCAAPFSASPVFSSGPSFKNGPHISSNINGSLSDVEEKLMPFGGVSSGTSNCANDISGFGSSMSAPIVDNLSLGSVSNTGDAISSQARTIGTAAASVSQSTLFQFGSSGFSSAPAFGLSGTNILASASPAFSFLAPAANDFGSNTSYGMKTVPSSKEVSTVGSTSGSANSLFGSNWQSNSSLVFGSTASSSTTSLPVFSAASSASVPTSTMPGSLFGLAGASAGSTFSSASASTSPSPFSAPQPIFGSSNPVFAFGAAASPANNGSNNNQMSIEDTMVEDTVQASASSTPAFGQTHSTSNPGFMFGSSSPPVSQPGTSLFQFGSHPSPAASVNQSAFQASSSFNGGGSFSLGTGGGDKTGRKIIKVKKGSKRR